MTHKFTEALQRLFRSWHVDCEYNRDDEIPKRIELPPNPEQTVYPDIIIHRRGPGNNLPVIEGKPSDASKSAIDYDKQKLKAYMSGKLGYRYGLLLTFVIGETPDVLFEWQPLS